MDVPSNYRGFTLIELIISIAIAAILLGIGIPSFRDAMMNGNLTSARSSLLADLHFARVEAVKNRTRIMVCARSTDTTCGTDWSNGWLVYEDGSPTGTPFDLDADEAIVRMQDASQLADSEINVETTIRNQSALAESVPDQFSFESRGRSGVSGLLVFCDKRGVDDARTIVITSAGAIRTDLAFDAGGNRIDPWGGALQCP